MKANILFLAIINIMLNSCGVSYPRNAIYNNGKFKLKNNIDFKGKQKADTSYYDTGKIKAIGHIAIGQEGNPSFLKVGIWKEYYIGGELKSIGNYKVSSYLDCGPGGSERIFYNLKSGEWVYYYPNSKIRAQGEYKIIKLKINTRCDGGDDLFYGITTDKWIFKTKDGGTYLPLEDEKKEFETITDTTEGFKIETFYDRTDNKVKVNVSLPD